MIRKLYHGSMVSGLKYLEPRHRYTPGAEHESPEGVYASSAFGSSSLGISSSNSLGGFKVRAWFQFTLLT